MVTLATLRKLALSFPETTEEPHFEKTSFKVKRKIFATHDATNERVSIKLSLKDQYIFSLAAKNAIYPVDNKWGQQGWTVIEMKQVGKELFRDALKTAYCCVAPTKLAAMMKSSDDL